MLNSLALNKGIEIKGKTDQPLLVYGTGKRVLLSSHAGVVFLSMTSKKEGEEHEENCSFATKSPSDLSQ